MKRRIVFAAAMLGLPGLFGAEPGVPRQPASESGPPVAICFTGSYENYAAFVAPLLKKYKFGATFYIDDPRNAPPGSSLDGPKFMTWDRIKLLAAGGFEIGNATTEHQYFNPLQSMVLTQSKLTQEVEIMEREFGENGIPKPATFFYPGGFPISGAFQMLAGKGYIFAVQYRSGGGYEPERDHPLLMPAIHFSGAQGEREVFYATLGNMKPGRIPVFCFSAVGVRPVGVPGDLFREYMKFLADRNFTVVSVRDVAKYANPGEAMRAVRLWRDGSQYLQAKEPAKPAPPKPVPDSAFKRRLESLILPGVDFKQVSLGVALEFLRQKSAAVSGGRLEPGFVVEPGVDAAAPVTLHLANVPFMEVLRYLGDLADVEFAVDEHAISVHKKTEASPRTTGKTPPGVVQMKAIKSLVLPKVEFKEASLESVLDALSREAAAVSGGQVQPCFVIQPGVNASAPVTLHLANIPFIEALMYLGDLAGAGFAVDRYAISVMPGTATGMNVKTPATGMQMQELRSLIIPKVSFKEASLESVLEFLRQKVAAVSKGSVSVSFVPRPELSRVPVTLDLENIPFAEVLRYAGEAASVEFEVGRYAIAVKRKGASAVGAAPASTPFALVK